MKVFKNSYNFVCEIKKDVVILLYNHSQKQMNMKTQKTTPIFSRYISESNKHEWTMREFGSYEDSGNAADHVVAIINRSPKNKIVAYSKEEVAKLVSSARYCSVGYDDDHQVKASEAIAKFC